MRRILLAPRLSLTLLIVIGFGAMLALTAPLATLSYNGASRSIEQLEDLQAVARQGLSISEMKAHVSEARAAAAAYADGAAAEDHATVLEKIAQSQKTMEAIRNGLEGDAAGLELLQAVEAGSADYKAAFAAYVVSRSAGDAAWTTAADAYEKAVKSLQKLTGLARAQTILNIDRLVAATQDRFMAANALLARYVVERNDEHLAAAEQKIADAKKYVDIALSRTRGGSPKKVATFTKDAIATYADAVVGLRDARIEQRAQQTALAASAEALDAGALALVSHIHQVSETRGAQQIAEAHADRSLTLLVSVSVAALAALLAWLIGNAIAGRIRQMARATKRLSDGDLSIDLDQKESDSALESMRRALVVFKANAQEVARMDERDRAAAAIEAAAERSKKIAIFQQRLSEVVAAASAGDFAVRLETRQGDEQLDAQAASLNQLLQSVETGVQAVSSAMADVAHGDLSARMEGRFDGAFAELQRDVDAALSRLGEMVDRISRASADIRRRSAEMTSAAQSISSGAEDQARALEQTAASMQEISQTIHSNGRSAENASETAAANVGRSEEGVARAKQASDAMARIENSAGRIAEIVGVIDSIAMQTNLLALNAAVEAARAGEAGKGFAIVATEVRSLAQRSADAANDIRGLAQESSAEVGEGAKLVSATGESFAAIVEASRGVSDNMGEITVASRQQTQSVEEVTTSITGIDSLTKRNAALSQDCAETALALSKEADALESLIEFFTIDRQDDSAAIEEAAADAA